MPRAYLNKINADLHKQIEEALDFIGWKEIIHPTSTVFVKPNLTWPEPRPGVTTSSRFLDALLPILTSTAGRVLVGESDGGTFPAEQGMDNLGFTDICRKYDVEFINLSRKPTTMIKDTVVGRNIEIEGSEFLLKDVDVFISIPVLKTHVVTRVTLGLKNQWGCIPSPMRLLYHHILDWGIVALNRAYNPQIVILDGTYAMDRRGPLEGDPISAGWLAVSDNVVTLDTIGARLLDVTPSEVRHIRFAEQEGLGTTDLSQVNMNRTLPLPVIHSVIKPNFMDRVAILIYRSYLLSKLAFDSPVTPLMYRLMKRVPPGTFKTLRNATVTNPTGH
jgi:uncharacterized protein (DUF362 family)